MNDLTIQTRHLAQRLTPIVALLMIVVLFAGAAHRHTDGSYHPCAVCTVGHSPAVSADITTPNPAPAGPSQTIDAPTQRAPRQVRLETASTRAPPRA